MKYLHFFYLVINILLITCILIRNPNEQSLQETLSSLRLFKDFNDTETNLDKLISYLVILYFALSFLLGIKIFR